MEKAVIDDRPPRKRRIGPGTQLKRLLHDRGYTATSGCGCNNKAAQMDSWGVAGCRERMEEIIDWLAEAAKKSGWVMSVIASAPFSRELLRSRIRAMVEEAIEAAEEDTAENSQNSA